jgi:hypothetical protein
MFKEDPATFSIKLAYAMAICKEPPEQSVRKTVSTTVKSRVKFPRTVSVMVVGSGQRTWF